jgi:hypothetical protein
MPKLPIFRFGDSEPAPSPELQFIAPSIALRGLQLGVDNLRYDVLLSPRVCEHLSQHFARYIQRFGGVESLLQMDVPAAVNSSFLRPAKAGPANAPKAAPTDLKSLLVSLHLAMLNRAKADENPSIDVLGRLAVIKFIRTELQAQFGRILEQCRTKSKSLEGVRQSKMLETRELVASFQIGRKIILRRTSEQLFRLLREIEKETLARTRRSLFGDADADCYRLFLNPLIFSEDGRDDYLCAEHYYMFGNFDKDVDRFANLRRLALEFLRALAPGGNGDWSSDDKQLEQALNVPENATALVGTGTTEESSDEDRARTERLTLWIRLLQKEGVLPHAVASYETVPLLSEFAPRVNPQQLKNALISREEYERVEKIVEEGRQSPERLRAAAARVGSFRAADRGRISARLLRDLHCYHRDLRGLEAVNAGLDCVNLIANAKVRELSTLNGMLYEFLPPEDQKTAEERVVHHVILKADVRDSSKLTRSLMERGMNAASYFSLNFYEPVNKLLTKYDAVKVFLEGDAIIIGLLEREGESMLGVSRGCVLAWDMLAILRGCNELLERSGLPPIEIGLGICYQESAPLYLMDGDRRIMISDAINESDRLSSCNKRVRKRIAPEAGAFQVYRVQIGGADGTEELTLNYNIGGICLSAPAFQKLQQEISLRPWKANFNLPQPAGAKSGLSWAQEEREFYVGTVPLISGTFRNIVIRKSRIAQVDVRDISILHWTDRHYYEVCTNQAVYAALEKSMKASSGE